MSLNLYFVDVLLQYMYFITGKICERHKFLIGDVYVDNSPGFIFMLRSHNTHSVLLNTLI